VRRTLAALLAALLLAMPSGAGAHTKSESHSDWRIVGRIVHLTFTVPEVEAKRIARAGEDTPSGEELAHYLADRVGATAGDAACPRQDTPQQVGAAPGFRRVEFAFQCPDAGAIALHSAAFLDLVPSHVTFAQISTGDGAVVEQLISRDHQDLDLADANGGNPLQNASFFEYIGLGIMHIFTGVDHQSFLLGLVLISRRLRDLVFVITGFTLGHSLTLALAVTGILRPHAEFIDALIGLTIALIGAENVAVATRRPGTVALGVVAVLGGLALVNAIGRLGLPSLLLLGAGLFSANYLMVSGHLRDAARLRLVVTLVFGLIHGFGFAADLLEMKLPAGRLAELLVGFNVGVEIGQLSLVLAMMGVVAALIRIRLALPRPIVVDVASAGLVAFGLYLLVTRGYA
jgi:hypothetical protein